MASSGKLNKVLLVLFLVACALASSYVEARDSVFFSKMKPVRRLHSQVVSSSTPALAPLASVEATPSPAPTPALSEVEPPSENWFYNQEVGEFPGTETEEDAKAVKKTSGRDDDINNDAIFGSQYENQGQGDQLNSYENEYTSNNDRGVNQYPDFRNGYKSNNNVHNYKYKTSYDDDNNDDNLYTSNYNTKDDTFDRYTDKNQYYTDRFESTEPRTNGGRKSVDNRRYYNANGDGYYRDIDSANQYNTMEEYYEGVYQP